MPNKPLTAKQASFVQYYCSVGDGYNNATQAAVLAGYSPSSAKVSGHNNITNYNVKRAIDQHRADLVTKSEYSITIAQQRLDQCFDKAIADNQVSAAVSAVVAANRMYGLDKDNDIGTDQQQQMDKQQRIEADKLAAIRLCKGVG